MPPRTVPRLALAVVFVAFVACDQDAAPPPPRADIPGGTDTAGSAAPAAAPHAGVETIALDPQNTEITFVGTKVVGRHDGGFREHSGVLHLDPTAPEKSHLRIEIATPSVWADDERLTAHLKSEDFFAVEQFPTAVFESTSIAPATGTDRTHDVRGTLDLRGVRKEITLPLDVDISTGRIVAEGTFEIDRQAFDIKYPGAPDNLIDDAVTVKVKVDAARGATEPAAAATTAAPAE